jgi:hypothetical protein
MQEPPKNLFDRDDFVKVRHKVDAATTNSKKL